MGKKGKNEEIEEKGSDSESYEDDFSVRSI